MTLLEKITIVPAVLFCAGLAVAIWTNLRYTAKIRSKFCDKVICAAICVAVISAVAVIVLIWVDFAMRA